MAPKKKKTFNQELEGLDQEELSTFNVDKFYTPKMTDDTKKTMLTAVVGKVQKALTYCSYLKIAILRAGTFKCHTCRIGPLYFAQRQAVVSLPIVIIN
jgi:hypothetical protein